MIVDVVWREFPQPAPVNDVAIDKTFVYILTTVVNVCTTVLLVVTEDRYNPWAKGGFTLLRDPVNNDLRKKKY